MKNKGHKLKSSCIKCQKQEYHEETMACIFTKCSICKIDDSTKDGEINLNKNCKKNNLIIFMKNKKNFLRTCKI